MRKNRERIGPLVGLETRVISSVGAALHSNAGLRPIGPEAILLVEVSG